MTKLYAVMIECKYNSNACTLYIMTEDRMIDLSGVSHRVICSGDNDAKVKQDAIDYLVKVYEEISMGFSPELWR